MSEALQPLEEWNIDLLIPYEKNAKIHTDAQVDKIARSISKHGLVNPPSIEEDGTIITGHGRTLALKKLGWKKVPVFVRRDLTKAQAAAVRLADNKVAEGAVDTNLVQSELRWLETEDLVDLEDLGFEERELAFLTEDIGEIDADLLGSDLAMETHTADIEHATELEIAAAEDERVGVAKALGFKDVTRPHSRTLMRFIATVSEQMGIDDPEKALVAFAEELMANE